MFNFLVDIGVDYGPAALAFLIGPWVAIICLVISLYVA